MKNNNPNVSLCYQVIRRSEYGSLRDVLLVSVQRRVSVVDRLAGTVNNRDGYGYSHSPEKGLEIANTMAKAYSEMLDAGHSEFFDYEIGHSFEIDYLLTDRGTHCSPTINASGSMVELQWAAKTVEKIAKNVEKNRAKTLANEHGRKYSVHDCRTAGNWSFESLDEVKKVLDNIGIKVVRYKSNTIEHFSELVQDKSED